MSIASIVFSFLDSAGATKSGNTLPIGSSNTAGALPTSPATDVSNIEPSGAPITGATMPTGGVGLTGWLSAIWSKLGSVVLAAGTAVIGKVGIDQTTPGTTNGVQVNAALPAGTNTIGATTSVINSPTQTSVTPGTSAYAAGYALGASGANAVQTFTVPTSGLLQNFSMGLSSGTYTGYIDLFIFKSAPASYTDGAAVTLSAADMAKLLAVVHLSDTTSLGGALAFNQALGTALSYNTGSTSLYILPVIRGANTFAASSSVTLAFEIVQ